MLKTGDGSGKGAALITAIINRLKKKNTVATSSLNEETVGDENDSLNSMKETNCVDIADGTVGQNNISRKLFAVKSL